MDTLRNVNQLNYKIICIKLSISMDPTLIMKESEG